MHGMRLCHVALLASMVAYGDIAAAGEFSVWDRAANPRLARDSAVLRDVQQLFFLARDVSKHRTKHLLDRALNMLGDIDAQSSPDPRLRFYFGRLLSRQGRDKEAVASLRKAIVFAPHHPSVGEAYFSLAISLARLGQSHEEIVVYERWLALQPDPEQRAIGLSNQAESYMAAGHVDKAVQTYREAIRLAHDNALAHWGLAVALDRSGNHSGALQQTAIALTYDPNAETLTSPAVFFIPAYDRFWYQALGASVRAKKAQTNDLKTLWWDRATLLWKHFLDSCPVNNRWRPIAELRYQVSAQAAAR